jgi:hypothetical protein
MANIAAMMTSVRITVGSRPEAAVKLRDVAAYDDTAAELHGVELMQLATGGPKIDIGSSDVLKFPDPPAPAGVFS